MSINIIQNDSIFMAKNSYPIAHQQLQIIKIKIGCTHFFIRQPSLEK
jgi:hypothetical protein